MFDPWEELDKSPECPQPIHYDQKPVVYCVMRRQWDDEAEEMRWTLQNVYSQLSDARRERDKLLQKVPKHMYDDVCFILTREVF